MLQLKRSLMLFFGLTLICGLIYPLLVTVIAQTLFPEKAQGSIIRNGEKVIGSLLIGQQFTNPRYFHGRPSAIDPPYDAGNSGGSNLAPSSARLIDQTQAFVREIRRENDLSADSPVPADLVLSSASGLDPHISRDAAVIQVSRIAKARKIPESDVLQVIAQSTEQPLLSIWGKERVNVLKMNLALDGIKTKR